MNELPGVWGYWGGAYLPFFLAGFLVSEPWRWAGALVGRGIDADSELFAWVRAVSTAIVAGLVARMLVLPVGELREVSLFLRVAAVACGVAGYFLARRNIAAGVGIGTVTLLVADALSS